MSREYVGVLGPVIHGHAIKAMVYEAEPTFPGYPGSYYFCCQACGNCSKHWNDADFAVVGAASHLYSFDHTPYLVPETPNEQSEERALGRPDHQPPS